VQVPVALISSVILTLHKHFVSVGVLLFSFFFQFNLKFFFLTQWQHCPRVVMVAFRDVLSWAQRIKCNVAKSGVLFPGLGFSCHSTFFFLKSRVLMIELRCISGDLGCGITFCL